LKLPQTYHSNGKLLITGEYLVLRGANALALPTKFGQDMSVIPIKKPILEWKSLDEKGDLWFQASFDIPLTDINSANQISNNLINILKQVQKQNPKFLNNKQGYSIKTKLDFPRNWGLGSSSTFINNLAQWAVIDAFKLLQKTMGGSGYDLACAQHNTPILYKLQKGKPIIKEVSFNPDSYKERLYFVHLNKKQYSNKEVDNFNNNSQSFKSEIEAVNEITQLILKVNKLKDFEILLKEHERIMSKVLQKETIQEHLFSDYFGQTKSLGAWGGDFILATGNDDTPDYFNKKGYKTVLLYDEMILKG
jgi:mevalonate kinase